VTENNLEQSIFEGNVSKLAHSPQTTKHSIHFISSKTHWQKEKQKSFFFASIYILLSTETGLVCFGYIDKGTN